MKKTFNWSLQRLPEIIQYVTILGVAVFISFLFPNHVHFKYNFEKGNKWQYDDLIAPFDYPILKTEEEIAAARNELDASFSPYYTLDSDVLEAKKALFKQAFDRQLESVRGDGQFDEVLRNKDKYYAVGTRFLEKIYSDGIVRVAPVHADKGKGFVINVVSGNTYTPRTLGSLATPESALEMVTDSLPYTGLRYPEFLLYVFDGTPDLIVPNLTYNEQLTQSEKEKTLAQLATSKGVVQKGDLIISSGELITDEAWQKLRSFQAAYEAEITGNRSHWGVYIGYFLLTGLLLSVFLIYVKTYAPKTLERFNRLVFITLWFVVFSYLTYLIEQSEDLSPYLLPFCIVPIVIRHFLSEQLALFTHIVIVLIASFITSLGYEFTFIQILAGIVATLTTADARHWNKFFSSVLFIGLTYAGAFLGLSLIREGGFGDMEWSVYSWFLLNVVLTLLAFPVIPLIERIFGFTSSISLVELSDMTRPLLKDLGLRAPGTLQHSLQVANLSEAAANEIGANPLLVKVGALYHDIGKMKNPEYFIENQRGDSNPHAKLSCLESAQIIIDHVTEGIKLAKKHGLPQVIINFIATHHGTTRVEYFYRHYLKENPNGEQDKARFQYPGPRPKTREETILMMADSLEASSKSLKSPTGKDIDDLVERIIASKIENRQFEESEMTFEELNKCKIVFKQLLRSINHVRVEYPDEQTEKVK